MEILGQQHGLEDNWALRDIQQRRQLLEAQSIKAASVALVATSLATKFLRRTTRTTMAFPERYLAADAIALDRASKSTLATYAQELLDLEVTAAASALSLTKMIAPGFGILAASIEAVAQGSITLLQEGRKLWQVMLGGLPAFSESYREIMNPDASEDEIRSELFVPIIFVPDWPRGPKIFKPGQPVREHRSEYAPSLDGSNTRTFHHAGKSAESTSDRAPPSSDLGPSLKSTGSHREVGPRKPANAGMAVGKDHSFRPTAKADPTEGQILNDIRTALISSE